MTEIVILQPESCYLTWSYDQDLPLTTIQIENNDGYSFLKGSLYSIFEVSLHKRTSTTTFHS